MNEAENQATINRYFGVNDEPCHWCGTTRFQHDGFHLVHVGGKGDVYGCDKCLGLDLCPGCKFAKSNDGCRPENGMCPVEGK